MTQERPVIENVPMVCPTTSCGAGMRLDSHAGYDARTGLECVHCSHCGHRGMKARDGVRLLFTRQQEYVFRYGPSLSYLKVVLSTSALNLFRVQGVAPMQLATHVAEWALLMGQACGTVQPSGDLIFSSCYEYCFRQALNSAGVSPR